MSKFGDIPTSNNPAFGNNPAVASKDCYHMFLVVILWQEDTVETDGTGVWRTQLPWRARMVLPDFGGSIAKFCFCADEKEIKWVKKALSTFFPASSNLKVFGNGDLAVVTGYEITARDCDCGFFTGDCKGNEEFELLDQGGDAMSYNMGFWITSTGEHRPFPSASKKDILQDIIDTERGKPLPCCKEKSSSSSTSLLN